MGHLSHLGCGIKHSLSLREQAILTLTGTVAGAAIDTEGHALFQISLPHQIMTTALPLIST